MTILNKKGKGINHNQDQKGTQVMSLIVGKKDGLPPLSINLSSNI
jgi:hypothetical protein